MVNKITFLLKSVRCFYDLAGGPKYNLERVFQKHNFSFKIFAVVHIDWFCT